VVGTKLGGSFQSPYSWHSEFIGKQVYPVDLQEAMKVYRLGPVPVTAVLEPNYIGPGYGCVGKVPCCFGLGNATCPACPAADQYTSE
jgi:hypothetical protein